MPATLRITSALKSLSGGRDEFQVKAGKTIRETLIAINLKPELFALVIVNGEQRDKDYLIADEDVIKVMAVIGGG